MSADDPLEWLHRMAEGQEGQDRKDAEALATQVVDELLKRLPNEYHRFVFLSALLRVAEPERDERFYAWVKCEGWLYAHQSHIYDQIARAVGWSTAVARRRFKTLVQRFSDEGGYDHLDKEASGG